MSEIKTTPENKIDFSQFAPKSNFSIPNLISLLRLALIPCIIYFYLSDRSVIAVTFVVISGLTDALDGMLARRLNQITTLGKVLDPLADKLTQVALAVCLCLSFPIILPLMLLLVVKELTMLYWGLRLLKSGKPPFSSCWWGKASTTSFYVGVSVIMIWPEQLGFYVAVISNLILLVMLYSMIRYGMLFSSVMHDGIVVK